MRKLLSPWPRLRGLTMIELLTVVALLALIVAVLVTYLFPNDDRRVKQEAERLAAYCEAAGGEAKMSEGAVRVVLGFEEGRYSRESARMGARLTDLAWREDEKVKSDKVRAPVQIVAVQVADVGTLEAGTAWLVWEDTKTRGGVVVLKLNEAIWSVVVEPATGQVRIERGRATLPDSGKGLKRSLRNPGLEALTQGTSLSPQALQNIFDRAPPSMPPIPEPPTAPGSVAPVGGTQVPVEEPGTPPELSPTPEVPIVPPTTPPTEPPEPPPDAAVNSEDAATPPPPPNEGCKNHPCPPRNGMNQLCVVTPGEDSDQTPRCVADPRGFAYMARNYSLGGFLREVPDAAIAEEVIRTLLNDSGYKFQLVFPAEGRVSGSFDPLKFPVHLVQGGRQLSGDTYRGVPNLTTSKRALAVLDAPEQFNEDEADALSIWVIWPSSAGGATLQAGGLLRSQQGEFTLTVPYIRGGEPCFWRMTTVMNVVAVLVPAPGNRHRLVARLHTCLGGQKANIRIDTGSGSIVLSQFLEAIIDPICDSNGDEVPDGWPIDVDAEMKPIQFADDPVVYQNAAVSPSCN